MPVLREGAQDEGLDGPVHDALSILAGRNAFGKQFFFGPFNGTFGRAAGTASKNAKHFLGYPDEQLRPQYDDRLREYLRGERRPTAPMQARRVARGHADLRKFVYPAPVRGRLIGVPGQGTHSRADPPDNWQSDNAVDLSFPVGTPLVALADGVIGSRFGALDSDDPRMQGLRCYLETDDNQFYYAHLSRFADGVRPGVRVRQGDVIGFSGSANGAPHLHIASEKGDPLQLFVEGA